MRTILKNPKRKGCHHDYSTPESKAILLLVYLLDVEKYISKLIKIAGEIEKYFSEALNFQVVT